MFYSAKYKRARVHRCIVHACMQVHSYSINNMNVYHCRSGCIWSSPVRLDGCIQFYNYDLGMDIVDLLAGQKPQQTTSLREKINVLTIISLQMFTACNYMKKVYLGCI